MRPLKVIGITAPRSGSSYWFVNYRRFLAQQTPEVAYLAECFHPAYQEQDFKFDNNQLEVFSKSSDNKRSFQETRIQTRITLERMKTSANSWVAKVFPSQMDAVPVSEFWNYVNHSGDNLRRVFLYRRDLEDRILSKLYALETSMYKTNQSYDYSRVRIQYRPEHAPIIRDFVAEQRELFNLYDQCDWDHVVCYEDHITGDPVQDLQNCFPGVQLEPLKTHLQKLISRQDKIDHMDNYDVFYREFTATCERLDVNPWGDPT